MISSQDLVETVSFEQAQVHDNMIVAEQNISCNIGIDTSKSMEKDYGCYIIKMSELTVLNEHGLQTSILKDNNIEIDDLKISKILISCAKLDIETMELRENMLKEYFILTMNQQNHLLVDGRICSFLNSSCRTIIVNYILEKGMKFYKPGDRLVDQNIRWQTSKEHKSISRKLNVSMYNVCKFVVEYIRDPSKSIDNLSNLDKTLIMTWRSLDSFINPIMIGAFVESIDEAQTDDKRSYIKTTNEDKYFRQLNRNNPNDEPLIIRQSDTNNEIKRLTESFQDSSFWLLRNSNKREAQQRNIGLTSNPSSPPKKKYRRRKSIKSTGDDIIISPIMENSSQEGDEVFESPMRYKQSSDQQSSNSLFSSCSKHVNFSNEEEEEEEEGEEEEEDQQQEQERQEKGEEKYQEQQQEEEQQHQLQEEETVEQEQQQEEKEINEKQQQQEQQQQQQQQQQKQQQRHQEEEEIDNGNKDSDQLVNLLNYLKHLDFNEKSNFMINSCCGILSQSDSDDSVSYDDESIDEPFFCDYDIEDIKKGLCVNLIYLITNDESQFIPTALVVDIWIERGGENLLEYYKLVNRRIVSEKLFGVNNSSGGMKTIILIDLKHNRDSSISQEMIFPELSYDDLYSYYYYNKHKGVPTHIFDLFFTILNIDIQNNYDRKDIILPLEFIKNNVYKTNYGKLSNAVLEKLKNCNIFYIPVYFVDADKFPIVGLLILQFKSINATAMLYYFELFPYQTGKSNPQNKYTLSKEMKRIIYDFIMPFFLKVVFPRNSIKLQMLHSVVISCIPNFRKEFLNNRQLLNINQQNYEIYLLLTISAHLIACIELGKEKSHENNLKPVENNLWCQWDNMKFLDKVSNIILYIVLNKTLPDYK